MSESGDDDALDEMITELESVIEGLEETEDDLSTLLQWAENAQDELDGMTREDRDAVAGQASELIGELRVISSPDKLINFGDRVQSSFSKPVEQSAVDGLHETIEALGVNLSKDRITEIEERVRTRPSRDLQTDANSYRTVTDTLNDYPESVISKIASEVESDESRYLIGPSHELNPLITEITERYEALQRLETIFATGGDWIPEDLISLTEREHLYDQYNEDIDTDGIATEVNTIDETLNELTVDVDLETTIQRDIRNRLEVSLVSQFQQEINEVASKLTDFATQYEHKLTEVADFTSSENVPESLTSEFHELESKYQNFRSRDFNRMRTVVNDAADIEESYESFLKAVSEELKMLDSMASQMRTSFDLSDAENPPTSEGLGGFEVRFIRGNHEIAFDKIAAFREWMQTAFDGISDQFDGEEVRDLFERLYTENEVPLSTVDVNVLRELQDDVPLIISLQQ